MSLKNNIAANYASQLYCMLISVVMIPQYVHYMGAEAYGLIGFFVMLQVWFQLFDLGMTPTMAREVARFRGGALDALHLRCLMRALEGIFLGVALTGAAAIIAGSGAIAGNWLKVHQLPLAEVRNAISLMAPIIALRWGCGLYRGVISGFEHQVWLSGFNSIVATVRFVLVIPFFIFIGTSPSEFFTFQLIVAMIEFAVLTIKTYRLLPKLAPKQKISWQWTPLRKMLGFSLSIAFTSAVWVMVTQTDKLVLSRLLPLSEYGYFTLAVLAANVVTVISGPVSIALQPRLTRLVAQGESGEVIRLYRIATQLVGTIVIPITLMLAFFSEQVLQAWTGNADIAAKVAPVLSLYAIGNCIVVLGAFPYYLQLAKGNLKMHLIGNALFVLLFIPSLLWASWRFGTTGAGYAWLGAHALLFLLWVPKVHESLVKGLHLSWLSKDIGALAFLPLLASILLHQMAEWPQGRMASFIALAGTGCGLLALSAIGSSWIREMLVERWNKRRALYVEEG